jgi:phage/plasmid-like protein (TIGR03299 family)
MLAKLPESTEVVAGDRIDGYFLVRTGHNGKTSFTARPTPIRVICANTLSIAESGKQKTVIKLKHVRSAEQQLDIVADLITNLVEALKTTNETFAQLADRKLTVDELEDYILDVLKMTEKATPKQVRQFESIADLAINGKGQKEFAPGSAWAAYNAITEYCDHVAPAEANTQKALELANRSAVFGNNNKLKSRALMIARQLVAV